MAIDFTLSPEQHRKQVEAREFAAEHLSGIRDLINPLPAAEERFNATRPAYEAAVAAGYLAEQIPEQLGGSMTSLVDLALIAEELIAVESSVPLSVLSTGLGLMPLLFFGTPEQHARFLPAFTSRRGAPLAGLAFSEPGGSANYANPDPSGGLSTVARRDGSEWVISGTKIYTPHANGWNGARADLFTVAARTDAKASPQESLAVFVVPGNTLGITVEGSIETIGQPGAEICQVRFDDVRIPAENILGAPGDGILIAETAFSATAGLVGAMSVGVARAAFQIALDFARNETRGGPGPVIGHQNVGTLLGDMKAKLEASRYLTWKACDNFGRSNGRDVELSIINKIFSSENAVSIVYDAMRVVGVAAYTKRVRLGELLNDALAYPLFDGGNVGVRRVQLQHILASPNYDPLAAAAPQAEPAAT
ncbi:acyl-CoA dehydrogenase [Arthrobacter sp. 24S4-2]|uniref:acyl-CoA dehydrogenase family protein n=1 Tax=Arthrobacter sp. 24S4-2 TaxID=2575374 RepID=UPI0010C7B72F|nr:acyl-CoA dehydrogenase family protein [Arthrobacter sp. 24S4-2]QCO98038.1 acyl-CoA dehydrogenase [Arthrobacter sp. 24S4-2]